MIRKTIFAMIYCTFIGLHLYAQNSPAVVFASEKQNKMASQIPGLLLKALMKGDIAAYYPQQTNLPVNYVQVLDHFGQPDQALAMLEDAPSWFCYQKPRKVDPDLNECFSDRFELLEAMKRDRVSQMSKREIIGIRLIHNAVCSPAAIDRYGPVFRIQDINQLSGQAYAINNPNNGAIQYSIKDLLALRLFAARTKK
ncbi:MAG: hypothetical protein R8G66_06700 [Cytophagales bacterium]|nr:hypothetical protein [Cytophagales bacterium]